MVRPEAGKHEGAKALGAFYTDPQVAEFLVWWAVRSEKDRVMDPSFGGGVFLRACAQRLAKLGGSPSRQVFGVEIDPGVHRPVARTLSRELGLKAGNMVLSDFFQIDPNGLPEMDAVVGNPPFIRYQRFSGDARKRALLVADREGVHLSRLSSSWAPFLVHTMSMLRQGGRLAMVVPMEIGHATYARPVIAHLMRSFGKVIFLTFRTKLFPNLSEDTLLLLAEDKGSSASRFLVRDMGDPDELVGVQSRGRRCLPGTRRMDPAGLAGARIRLIEYLIPRKVCDLYRKLKNEDTTRRLGDLADVGIGYVTGANDFFHLSPEEAEEWGMPQSFLKPAVRRGRQLPGVLFTKSDWVARLQARETGYLLYIDGQRRLPKGVAAYLKTGESSGVSEAYKCRTRSPWYAVPHVYCPDAFLTYMSGAVPKLVANIAGVVAPNSLHIVRIRLDASMTGERLATLWQNSLTRLSAEIEGHAMGGGMLKLEPKEAANVLLPLVKGYGIPSMARELDRVYRQRGGEDARRLADKEILIKRLGLSQSDCRLLRKAAESLVSRRYRKGSRRNNAG